MNNLVNDSLPGNVTFTRASGGTYFGSDGLLKTAANNEPRFDHNPLTGVPRGLLVEGQRTNLLLWNRDLTNAAWMKTNMTVAKSAVGIDGVANSASRLTAGANNATVVQAVTNASIVRAVTAYVRRVSGTGTVEMTLNGGTDWTTVTVTGSWTRVGPPVATLANPSVGFRLATSDDVIEVDFVQLENHRFASSAIATAGTTATRAADVAYVTNLATIGYNPVESTFFVEYERDHVGVNDAAVDVALQIDNGTDDNRLSFFVERGVAPNIGARQWFGAYVGGDVMFSGQVASGKAAAAIRSGDSACAVSGEALRTFTAASSQANTFNRLNIGHRSLGNQRQLFGWVRRVAYWPVRLSNGQLQALTQ